MRRFLLRENIRRFQALLDQDGEHRDDGYLLRLLIEMRRELALLEAASLGAQDYPVEFGRVSAADAARLRDVVEKTAAPVMIIDPRAGLHIVDMNEAYAAATLTQAHKVLGEALFDVFPDNPEVPDASGVTNLFSSLRRASHSRVPHPMEPQRYDVRDPEGQFVERHWQSVNTPIFNEDGQLGFLLHNTQDITTGVPSGFGRQGGQGAPPPT